MKTSIINGTLSKEDAFARHELPRLEQIVKGLLTQTSNGLAALNSYLQEGAKLSVAGAKHEYTGIEIKALAPDQYAEAKTVAEALGKALKEIGYLTAESSPPASATVGVAVDVSTSQEGNKPPLKTATITPKK